MSSSRLDFSLNAQSVSMWCIHASRIDTTAVWKKLRFVWKKLRFVWKKLRFVLSHRSDFHMIDILSIAVYVFARRILMSFSVDETPIPRYMNLSIIQRNTIQSGHVFFFFFFFLLKTHILRFVCINMKANIPAACPKLCSLGSYICKKLYVICVVCARNSL